MRNQLGQGLVGVLAGVAITGIVIAAVTTMLNTQQREVRAIAERLAALDTQRAVTGILVDAASGTATLAGTNVASGNLTFNPATIVSTDPSAPTPIVYFRNLYTAAGTSVFATTTVRTAVSPLSGSLVLQSGTGLFIGGYRQGAGLNYVLRMRFDQTGLIRPVRDLTFPVQLTTTPSGGSLTITAMLGSGSGSPGAGAMCGHRVVFCGWPNTEFYDNNGALMGGITTWISPNIPCEGNTLTADCDWGGDPNGNVRVISVSGCPSGYTGMQTQVGCHNSSSGYGCASTNSLAISQLFCLKN